MRIILTPPGPRNYPLIPASRPRSLKQMHVRLVVVRGLQRRADKTPLRKPDKVRLGKSRHFDRAPLTSDLPRLADVLWVGRHVAEVPLSDMLPFRRMQDLIASQGALRDVPTFMRRSAKMPLTSASWLHPELLHLRPPAVTCRRGWLAPQSGLKSDLAGAPVCANTGCGWLLFDHLVGTHEQR